MGHNHHHDHCHGLGGHNHGAGSSIKMLLIAIALILVFAVIEAVAGVWAHSLALLGDAGHMASDAVALAVAAFAAWIANKPPSHKYSYGLGRAEILAAWLSSLLMLLVSALITMEAIYRIDHPSAVKGLPVIAVAIIGLTVNLFVAWILTREQQTLNTKAALTHVLGDVLGSFAALFSGLVIHFSRWYLIDPILSIFIGILIAIASFNLLKESLRILMEGVPSHININNVEKTLSEINGINTIHNLHIWALSSDSIALSCHANIQHLDEWPVLLSEIRKVLKEQFNINHITFQPEPETTACNPCNIASS